MREFTEQLLREAVKEADQKKQNGLLIWLSRTIWDEARGVLSEGNEHYDFALAQVSKGEDATITMDCFGFKIPAIFAVSVPKMKNSEEYFQMIVNACRNKDNIGPITLIPINEVVECCD